MAAMFKTLVGGIINVAGANLNPYKVQHCEPDKQQKQCLVERNGCVSLYKQTGCYEAVLYNSEAYPDRSFSLFRLMNEGESLSLFRTLSPKLVLLYTSSLKVYQVSVLQQICDVVREKPTWTVAHVAAHVGLVDAFYDKHISSHLNAAPMTRKLTPLMVAVMAGHEACVEELLKLGCRLDCVDVDGNTAYHIAVQHCPNALKILKKKDPKGRVMNFVNGSGQTAIHLACKLSKPNCTSILLDLGADVKVTACDTKPVHVALLVGDTESAKLIMEAHKDEVNSRDNHFNGTPAHWAHSKQAVELCIDMGCDMNGVSDTGDTPLNVMLERGRIECVTSLICHGICVNTPNKNGNTPLHLAVIKDDIDLVKSLLVFGADCDVKNRQKQTPRHIVATSKMKNRDVILYILHLAGAHRCSEDSKGCVDGCVMEGTYNGKPDETMIHLQEQTRQVVDDALDEALGVTSDHTQNHHGGAGKANRPQRVLCLDGGGIRGLVLIQMLLAIERAAGRPIRDCFDWVGGTSTGGILAIGIAIGKTLQQLLGMYFGLKDKVFVGTRPYCSKPLEQLLKKELSETLCMSDIDHPRILVTGVLADRFPPELHFFRNYEPPVVYRPTSEGPLQSVHPPPSEQYVWQAARCSGAAPTYFRPCGPFLDGGLMSNNPTLDVLTEIHEYNAGLKSQSRHSELLSLGVVVSLGTGIIPTNPVKTIDVFKPGGIIEAWKSAQGVSALFSILQDQATVSEGRPNDRARAWCSMIDVPYFRLSPQLSEDVPLDAHDDKTVLNMMWETQCYIANKKPKILQLASYLREDKFSKGKS